MFGIRHVGHKGVGDVVVDTRQVPGVATGALDTKEHRAHHSYTLHSYTVLRAQSSSVTPGGFPGETAATNSQPPI